MSTPMTAHKARYAGAMTALGTLALWAVGRWTGAVELPSESMMQEAISVLISTAVTGGTAAVTAYIKSNFPKGG